jgi:hypothetical protein
LAGTQSGCCCLIKPPVNDDHAVALPGKIFADVAVQNVVEYGRRLTSERTAAAAAARPEHQEPVADKER